MEYYNFSLERDLKVLEKYLNNIKKICSLFNLKYIINNISFLLYINILKKSNINRNLYLYFKKIALENIKKVDIIVYSNYKTKNEEKFINDKMRKVYNILLNKGYYLYVEGKLSKELFLNKNIYVFYGLSFSISNKVIINNGDLEKFYFLEKCFLEKNFNNKKFLDIIFRFYRNLNINDDFSLTEYKYYIQLESIFKDKDFLLNYFSFKKRYLKNRLRLKKILIEKGYFSIQDFLKNSKKNKKSFSFTSTMNINVNTFIGKIYKVSSKKDSEKFIEGRILVTNKLDTQFINAINKAEMIILENISLNIHGALILKELHKKVIFGVKGLFFNSFSGDEIYIDFKNKILKIK